MSSLEPLITYYRENSGFAQRFFLTQNGQPLDLTLLPGVVVVKWWFRKQAPDSIAKEITSTGVYDGVDNNRVTFVIPEGFFDEGGLDYDCNIEVSNDSTLNIMTDPDFITRVKQPAGSSED